MGWSDRDFCGCCGKEVHGSTWCSKCSDHVLKGRFVTAAASTYYAQYAVDCPFQVGGDHTGKRHLEDLENEERSLRAENTHLKAEVPRLSVSIPEHMTFLPTKELERLRKLAGLAQEIAVGLKNECAQPFSIYDWLTRYDEASHAAASNTNQPKEPK